MKKVIHKAYWNFEKEQNWINSLAARGLALTDYSWCRYVFEETEPGEYIYQLELLEHKPRHPESEQYLRFLEEAGIEVVAVYMCWVFLRKKAADGPFTIYSDNGSKIRYLKRVRGMWLGLGILEASIGLVNLGLFLTEWLLGRPAEILWMNLIGGLLCLGFGITFFATLFRPVHVQIRRLLKEKDIRE